MALMANPRKNTYELVFYHLSHPGLFNILTYCEAQSAKCEKRNAKRETQNAKCKECQKIPAGEIRPRTEQHAIMKPVSIPKQFLFHILSSGGKYDP